MTHLAPALLAIAILGGDGADRQASSLTRLEKLIEADDTKFSDDAVTQAALDAGPPAVPLLRTLLRRGDEEERGRALLALAYIGGRSAVEVLRAEFKRTGGMAEKSLLAFSMASTGSAQDRTFLVRSLRGEHFGDEWMPIVSAALSLGVLRAKETLPALEASARRVPDSLASHAAAEAVRWIRQGRWSVDIPVRTETDSAIAAVLSNGIPRTDEAERFYDADRQGYWQRHRGTWTFGREPDQDKAPSLGFKTYLREDRTRAVVSVRVYFGNLNAIGYDYVLRKETANWLVQGVLFTWIS